ncbi:MAG: hypothetical protein WCF84_22135 [Anaerolineae bacterium]
MFDRINAFLDTHVLPWPVRFLTFRFVILATIALLIPLIVYADNTSLVLLINSYLNTMSVAVSSIVLLYATLNEVRQKKIADMQEHRAQEDHTHVTEMHGLVLQQLANQREELQDMKELLVQLQGQAYVRQPAAPTPNLRELHPRGAKRYELDDIQDRMAQVPGSDLTEALVD